MASWLITLILAGLGTADAHPALAPSARDPAHILRDCRIARPPAPPAADALAEMDDSVQEEQAKRRHDPTQIVAPRAQSPAAHPHTGSPEVHIAFVRSPRRLLYTYLRLLN
jgi:hypothetical protein